MFKPTQCLEARLRLTTKQVNKGYYKGNRTGSMGYFGKHGRYIIDWKKVRTYVFPENFDEFKLTPFVTSKLEPTRDKYMRTAVFDGVEKDVPGTLTGKDFLKEWMEDNEKEAIKLRREDLKKMEEDEAAANAEQIEDTSPVAEEASPPGDTRTSQ